MADKSFPLAEEEVASLQWADMRERLRRILEAYEKLIDREVLTQQLLQPQSTHEGHSLVTPKAATLVQLLSEYKVGPQSARVHTAQGNFP